MQKKCSKCGLPIIILLVIIGVVAGGLAYYYFFNTSTDDQNPIKQKTIPTKNRVTIELEQGKIISEPFWRYDATSTIKVDGKAVAQITSENGQPVKLFRETSKNAYFLTQSSGVGGYILYDIGGLLYKLDLNTLKLKAIPGGQNISVFNDVSHDEELLAWTGDNTVLITNDSLKIKNSFPVDKKYEQFGAVKFSPDDTKIAYSASIGYPDENERTAIFVVDIISGKQTKIAETTTHLEWIEFIKWVDNKTVRIERKDYTQSDLDPIIETLDLTVK